MTFSDWLAEELGTRNWFVGRRWSHKLREKYDCRVHPDRFKTLRRVFEEEQANDRK